MSKNLFQIKKQASPSSYQKLKLSLLLVLCQFFALSQITVTIQNQEEEPLIGVEVYSDDLSFANVTDTYGEISLPTDKGKLNLRYLGYAPMVIDPSSSVESVITMNREEQIVDEVTIVGRTGVIKEEIPYQIETINQKAIAQSNSQTAADALAANANVYVQKSQMGGGSPVLRGFEANKILLVVDGVRLNNAIYRSGHLQNAITIDQAMLERMEVIFGAGSLNYGSDALGGVIHFRSKDPKLNFDESKKSNIEQGFYTRYSTANKEKSLHYDFMYGNKKWGSLSSVTFASYDDLSSGERRTSKYPDFGKRLEYIDRINGQDSILVNNQPQKQIGTGYAQLDLMQKFLFQPNEKMRIVLNGQYSTSSDVPRYDQLTERDDNGVLNFAEWYYGPQKRLLLSARMEHTAQNSFYDKSLVIASYQKIDEDRIDRQYQSDQRLYQEEDVSVIGLTIDFTKQLKTERNQSIKYGFDFQSNNVVSESFEENIVTGQTNFNVLGRYPSAGSSMESVGLYGQYTWKNKSGKLISNTGFRLSRSNIAVQYDSADPFPWPQSFLDGLMSSNNSIVGSTGINYNASNGIQFHALAATAFRAPNIDDMAKIRVKGEEVSVPNLALNPEKSINGELGLTKKWSKKNYFQAAVFYTHLDDVIIREPHPLPDGSTFIVDGTDTLYTFGNVNAETGFVYGLTSNASINLVENLFWNGSINYTYGRANGENGQRPLAHIPPVFGKMGLSWSYEKFEIQGLLRFNAKKDIADFGDSTDNPEQATPEGSLGWKTINLYMSYPYYEWLQLSIGVENILDEHYRQFSSGVSSPGRNLILSLKGRF